MELFVSWQVAWDQEDSKFAILADDPEALRRKNQSVEAGRRIWESWLLRCGGQTIDFSGADGHCIVPAQELADLERIRSQYSQTLGDSVRVAVGVGIKLSEADQALRQCRKQGGDKIVLFTPNGLNDKNEEEGLNKASGPGLSMPAKNPGTAGGGISGATRPQAPAAAQSPQGEASEHSEAEGELSALDNAPPPGELTHSAADAQAAFEAHADAADEQEKSQDANTAKGSADAELKKEVVKVLQQVKAQAPALQQLTATEPKLFAVIQESIRAMLMLAKRLVGAGDPGAGQPVQKSEVASYLRNKIEAADKDPVLKSDRFFVKSAFLGKDGKVITTGQWHDIEQLPEGFEIAQEGFVSGDGVFYDRDTATEMSTPLDKAEKTPIKPEDIKTEFKSKDGIVIPSAHHPARKAYDRAHIERMVGLREWSHMNFKPRMVKINDLAHASSGNMAVNKDRYNLYRRMLAAGDRLPAIVVRKNGLKYDIVDGSHRVQAILDHNGNNVGVPQKVPEIHALEMSPKSAENKTAPGIPFPKGKLNKEEPVSKKLPLPENAPTHTAHTYPVGAVKDHSAQGTRDVGKVKVSTENGSTKWRSVRAGMVMAADGNPTSSRNPSGK